MAGLSLIHAGFLAATLAAAIPIVIHLLFRRRTRPVTIGSVRFLQKVVREHRRRRRVRQWLLLALRMLAVLLLAALFARPYFDKSRQLGLNRELVLLVDRSASMQVMGENRESTFAQAITRLRSELGLLNENVIAHVAFFDAAGVDEKAVSQIGGITPSSAATDYGLALSWARDVLVGSSRETREIILISDFQRSGLPKAAFPPLGDEILLSLADVGESVTRNLAVDSVEVPRGEILPDGPVKVRAVARNHGPLPSHGVSIRCELRDRDGREFTATRRVDLAAFRAEPVDFEVAIEHDGLYRGQIVIESDDSFTLDNRRWFAFEARHPDRVLLVDGQESRSAFGNETYYLETALRLRAEGSREPLRSFESERIVWEAGQGFPRLEGYRAVVLANVRRLSDEDGARLAAFVKAGGGLLVSVGDQTGAASLDRLLRHGLLPGTIADRVVDGSRRVDQWDRSHAALACFADAQHGDMRRVDFHKTLPIESLAPDGKVLMESGELKLVGEIAVGGGSAIYFGSSIDRDWTELPRGRMYVPLMRQLLAYLTNQLAGRSAVVDRLVEKPGEQTGIAPWTGETVAELPEGNEVGRWVVTNVDPRESALERLTPEEFQDWAGGRVTQLSKEASVAALGIKIPPDSLRADEIWSAIAWLLLALLGAETLLASRVHA